MMEFTCDRFQELMFDYIDDNLNKEDKANFEKHVNECAECDIELNKAKAMLETIKESRYVTNGELYVSLVPLIKTESKRIRLSDIRKKIYRYGVVAVAAVFIFVVLIHSIPKTDLVSDNSTGTVAESYEADLAMDEAVPEEKMIQRSLFSMQSEEDSMLYYLNTYAPEYADTTQALYVYNEEVELPEQVVTSEVEETPQYTIYVINKFANSGFEINDNATVYNTQADDYEKPYIIIISFNSNDTE